jgi:predicted TIM-barrel fold metal-dependent hydrolase
MTRAYNVVDADGHILEPLDLWDHYIDPTFRDRAPRIVKTNDGKERLVIEENMVGDSRISIGRIGGVGARQGIVAADTLAYKDGKPGGFDPHKRIPDMDADGIDAVFLYPSLGLFSGAIHDPQLAAAVCRAYNRWLADYCNPYPDRLFGVAMLPLQDVNLAIAEMRFAKKELGFKGGFLRPNPYDGKMINHPDFEPFWAAAEDLDFSIGFHEGASSGMPTVGVDRFEGRGAKHIISHTMEMMLACLAVIWGGVCEKHPKVRIGFLESGGGWIAPWLDRMDRHFDDQSFNDSGLKTRPSDLFRRNCWISFEPVEGSLNVLADYVGPNKIMWATDYPHSDGFFPGAPDMMRERLKGTSLETQRGVLAGGALAFYGMH